MTSVKCKICNRTIAGSSKIFEDHCQGRKHMNLLPAFVTVKAPFELIDKIDNVHQYFAKFGTITSNRVRTEGEGVSVDYYFKDRKAYTAIVQENHCLFNEKLEISWIPRNPNISHKVIIPKPASNQVERPAVVKLDGSQSTNSKTPNQPPQLSPFKKPKMANASTEESRLAVINSVKEGKTFAQQVAILQSKLQTTNKAEVEKNRRLIQSDLMGALAPMFPLHQIHFFGSTITGLAFQGSDLDVYVANVRQRGKPEVITLKTIRMLIYKSKKFCDLLLISGATVPIIKCIHTKTQICCDLNIRNKLSVQNSKLIKYYLTLDEKLRPLMIVVKFWTECYGLKKVNFFSGYALYLMVIFYLQQEPYNLPSIADLQKDCPANIEDEWNCAFSTPANEYPALRDESLLNLVAGFFRFYGNFDYVTQVISPYLGTTVKKVAFMSPFDLPDSYHLYKGQNKLLQINSGISIQDPFEHNRNVSGSIPLQYVGRFAVLCKVAEQYTTTGETELLHKLLTKCGVPSMNEVRFVINKSDSEKTDLEWFSFAKTFTIRVLKEVLNCQVTEITTSSHTQIIDCVSQNNIWDNRISAMKTTQAQLPPEISDFDREIAIVQNILKFFPQALVTKFVLTALLRSVPSRIEYIVKLKCKCKIFFHVAHYLRIKFPTWFKIIEAGEKETVSENVPQIEKGPPLQENSEENKKPVETAYSGENIEMIKTDDKISVDSNVCKDSSPRKQVETSTDSPQSLPTVTEAHDHEEALVEEAKPDEEGEDADAEDVPPDFFDDFSNEDFMDGLDIVDAWDEDSGKLPEEDDEEKKKHSPIRFSSKESFGKSSEKRKRLRSKSRSPVRRRKRSGSFGRRPRSRSRSRDKLRSDIRRDPEKTKRDIHKDKMKCAKDKEQKLVTDKLKIVETGLVPPGTEMDVDLTAIMKEKQQSTGDGVERVKSDREKKHPRRSGSKEGPRKPARYSRSPIFRYRNRAELAYRRRRTSSIDSNASDRELWMRSRRKRSHSRSRDSPPRLKPRKYDDKPKKKSFLEEIRDKLNEVRPVPVVQYNHPNLTYVNPVPPPHPIPAPVPAPSQFFPQPTMQHQQYDQRFFIGDANPVVQTQVFNNPLGHAAGNMVSVPQVQMNLMPQVPIVPKLPVVQQNTSSSPSLAGRNETSAKPTERNNKQTSDDIDKLFADKKISLSDFLTITAKCEVQSASPEHLQKKIKVISRCQDVIKAMSEDRKFTGRLSVRPSSEAKNKSEVKYQSPLRRIPIVRFQFTTPSKLSEEADTFGVALDRILQKIGLLKETIDLEETADVPSKNAGNSSFADENTTALTLKASMLNSKTITDVAGCEECKKRKVKQFADVGSQCADGKETVSIGTQVSEEELTPIKGLLKNESIAYLTPAQLLGKDKEKEKEVVEASTTPTVVSEKAEKKKIEAPKPFMDNKKDKVKAPIRGRGGYRKQLRDRQFDNYGFEEEFEYFDRERPSHEFEDLRESFGHRFGGRGTPPVRYPRHFMDNGQPGLPRMNQLREEQGNMFTDFNQSFRGRNPNRFGPRY